MAFHKAQKQAIIHDRGPMMVLAGPGSGKTTVITHRVRYLIDKHNVNPSHILVITFTNAAAREMRERFLCLSNNQIKGVEFGTFHSVFFRILKYAYRYDASNIIREEQRIRLIRELIDHYDADTEDKAEFALSVLSEISAVKSEMLSLDFYYAKSCSEEVFKKIYRGYDDYLKRENLLDFDDMLIMCYELLKERSDILSGWQKRYRYILIDEFQDINRIQYEVIKMLAMPENNLFIVGDDDQSIYRFRGARPEIMLGFERDYPNSERVVLNINYRSVKEIAEASKRLIAHNKTRFEKNIVTEKSHGKPVSVKQWRNSNEETLGIVKEIKNYIEGGYELSDIAVLYRTNQNPRLLISRLMEYNIPFKMRDSIPDIYEHWIAKDIISYIRIAMGELERNLVIRIINKPKRYISRDAFEKSTVLWQDVKSFYQDKDWMEERIERLEYDLRAISKMAPYAAVNYIRKTVGYDEYLQEYAKQRNIKSEELEDVLEQLHESSGNYKTFTAWFVHMEEYRQRLLKKQQNDDIENKGISLMTMHSAKGLEYKIVYILDVNEKIIPYQKAALDADVEEERRLLYVAMTRAKERLHIYYVNERYNRKQDASRFIGELLEKEAE